MTLNILLALEWLWLGKLQTQHTKHTAQGNSDSPILYNSNFFLKRKDYMELNLQGQVVANGFSSGAVLKMRDLILGDMGVRSYKHIQAPNEHQG